jgi:hypothetical protein
MKVDAEQATLTGSRSSKEARPPTSTGDTYEAWREGPHDDLVLAVKVVA